MKKNIAEKFWNEWLEANEDGRIKLVQNTMIARELAEHLTLKMAKAKIQKRFIKEMAARNINDYFQDLEQCMITRKSL
jgi:predicted nucleic acid-binding protein